MIIFFSYSKFIFLVALGMIFIIIKNIEDDDRDDGDGGHGDSGIYDFFLITYPKLMS